MFAKKAHARYELLDRSGRAGFPHLAVASLRDYDVLEVDVRPGAENAGAIR